MIGITKKWKRGRLTILQSPGPLMTMRILKRAIHQMTPERRNEFNGREQITPMCALANKTRHSP
jgi:hypothetical protein